MVPDEPAADGEQMVLGLSLGMSAHTSLLNKSIIVYDLTYAFGHAALVRIVLNYDQICCFSGNELFDGINPPAGKRPNIRAPFQDIHRPVKHKFTVT